MTTTPTLNTRPHTDRDWRSRGACRQEDPELFHPVGKRGPALAQEQRAKAVCRRCPVQITCREWAITAITAIAHGVVGGMNPTERRQEFRRRAVTAKPEEAKARAAKNLAPGQKVCAAPYCAAVFTPCKPDQKCCSRYCGRQVSASAARTRTHCRNGHKFTPDNTMIHSRQGRKTRECRTCARAARNKRRQHSSPTRLTLVPDLQEDSPTTPTRSAPQDQRVAV